MLKKVAIRMRIKPPKRRTPGQRIKARLYYRSHRAKIRLQRRKYIRQHKSVIKNRKMFKRYKPAWFKKPRKVKHIKPKHIFKHLFKLHTPKVKRPKKIKHKF